MSIIRVLDKDVLDYWDVKDMTDLKNRFELNGEVYFEKGEIHNGYNFFLGPSIDNGLSDSISMNRYIESICKDLSINVDVGVAENAHKLKGVVSNTLADTLFRNILLRIKADGFTIDRHSTITV